MTDRMLKWSIPVDDEAHEAPAVALHIACQSSYESVEVWTLESAVTGYGMTKYQVYGTGQPTPDGAEYVGTALAVQGALVWHLFDVSKVTDGV